MTSFEMNLSDTAFRMFPMNASELFQNFDDFAAYNNSTMTSVYENLLYQSENFSSNFLTYSTELPVFHKHEQIFVSKSSVKKFLFIFGMVLIPMFSLFGSMGNILSIVVLVHHRMRNTTNYCLAALALSDLLFLSHSLWFAIINIYKSRDPIKGDNLRILTYPVLGAYGSVVTARITSWLTSMLSVDRFIAVYCPMKAKTICSKRLTCVAIFLIYTITAVTFIPLALKYKATYKQVSVNNQTHNNILQLTKTSLGEDKQFLTIYGIFLNIVFRFLPCLVLIILNILIIIAIRKTWNLRRIMSKNSNSCKMYEQNRITVMLLIVSFVFVICILPGAVNSTCSQIWQEYSRLGKNRNLYACISSVTYFLETVNSSINFIIYMAFSAKFCRTYKEIFCCVPPSKSHRNSREVIRFSRRPLGSSSSVTSFRDYKVSFVREAQRGLTEGLECVHSNGHIKSKFDVEQIKLLCYHKGKRISESELERNQYN